MKLPPATAALALVTMHLWTLRERKGANWCRDKLVGPLREMAETPPVIVDIAVPGSKPTSDILAEVRGALRLHCTVCGKCDLGKE